MPRHRGGRTGASFLAFEFCSVRAFTEKRPSPRAPRSALAGRGRAPLQRDECDIGADEVVRLSQKLEAFRRGDHTWRDEVGNGPLQRMGGG